MIYQCFVATVLSSDDEDLSHAIHIDMEQVRGKEKNILWKITNAKLMQRNDNRAAL